MSTDDEDREWMEERIRIARVCIDPDASYAARIGAAWTVGDPAGEPESEAERIHRAFVAELVLRGLSAIVKDESVDAVYRIAAGRLILEFGIGRADRVVVETVGS